MDFDAVDRETGEIVEVRSGAPSTQGTWTAVGLLLPDGLSYQEWSSIGDTLKAMERSVMWWIGDWLRFGERRYGEMYSQALDATEYSYSALANAKWVAEQFPELSRRRENLSWSHHREAAALPPNERIGVLDTAEAEGWSRQQLRAHVARVKNRVGQQPNGETGTVDDLRRLADMGRQFGTVYADPPWLYGNQGTRAATGNHYGGMTIDELCDLPVSRLAADDAHLHLWTTNAFLFECPRIMAAWGFEYKSCFVWAKPQMGIGNYWRVSHEFLLLGKRGNPSWTDRSLMSWAALDRGQHSAKPDQVRGMIERASPEPRLELFGRKAVHGWTVWGNEVSRDLLTQQIPQVA